MPSRDKKKAQNKQSATKGGSSNKTRVTNQEKTSRSRSKQNQNNRDQSNVTMQSNRLQRSLDRETNAYANLSNADIKRNSMTNNTSGLNSTNFNNSAFVPASAVQAQRDSNNLSYLQDMSQNEFQMKLKEFNEFLLFKQMQQASILSATQPVAPPQIQKKPPELSAESLSPQKETTPIQELTEAFQKNKNSQKAVVKQFSKSGMDTSKPGCLWKRNPLKLDKHLKKQFEQRLVVCAFCGHAIRYEKNQSQIAKTKQRLKLHAKQQHFWCFGEKADHYIQIGTPDGIDIEWDREHSFVWPIQSDMINYLKCVMDEKEFVAKTKNRIKQHNTKATDNFDGAESRYNLYAREYSDVHQKLPTFEELVRKKGPALKYIKEQVDKGKCTQEHLDPDDEEVSNQTFRLRKNVLKHINMYSDQGSEDLNPNPLKIKTEPSDQSGSNNYNSSDEEGEDELSQSQNESYDQSCSDQSEMSKYQECDPDCEFETEVEGRKITLYLDSGKDVSAPQYTFVDENGNDYFQHNGKTFQLKHSLQKHLHLLRQNVEEKSRWTTEQRDKMLDLECKLASKQKPMYLWKFSKAKRFYKNLHPTQDSRLSIDRPVAPYGLKPDGWTLPKSSPQSLQVQQKQKAEEQKAEKQKAEKQKAEKQKAEKQKAEELKVEKQKAEKQKGEMQRAQSQYVSNVVNNQQLEYYYKQDNSGTWIIDRERYQSFKGNKDKLIFEIMDEINKRNASLLKSKRDQSCTSSFVNRFDQNLNLPSSERQHSVPKSPMQTFEFPAVYDNDRQKVYVPKNLIESISMAECKELAEIYFAYFHTGISPAPKRHKTIFKLSYVCCPEQEIINNQLRFPLPPMEGEFRQNQGDLLGILIKMPNIQEWKNAITMPLVLHLLAKMIRTNPSAFIMMIPQGNRPPICQTKSVCISRKYADFIDKFDIRFGLQPSKCNGNNSCLCSKSKKFEHFESAHNVNETENEICYILQWDYVKKAQVSFALHQQDSNMDEVYQRNFGQEQEDLEEQEDQTDSITPSQKEKVAEQQQQEIDGNESIESKYIEQQKAEMEYYQNKQRLTTTDELLTLPQQQKSNRSKSVSEKNKQEFPNLEQNPEQEIVEIHDLSNQEEPKSEGEDKSEKEQHNKKQKQIKSKKQVVHQQQQNIASKSTGLTSGLTNQNAIDKFFKNKSGKTEKKKDQIEVTPGNPNDENILFGTGEDVTPQ